MKYYDLHLHSNISVGQNSVADMAKFAASLGFSGIVFCDNFQDLAKLKELRAACKLAAEGNNIEVYPGVKLEAKNAQELKQLIGQVREHVVIVAVHGGDYAINRTACEDARVDVLCHPELNRPDGGLDDHCMRSAAKNIVAIEINFRNILHSYRKARSHIMNHVASNIKLAEAFKAPLVICSGAQSTWDIRDPRELISIANILGQDLNRAFLSLSEIPQVMIGTNKKKLAGISPTKGVEVIGWET